MRQVVGRTTPRIAAPAKMSASTVFIKKELDALSVVNKYSFYYGKVGDIEPLSYAPRQIKV